MANTPTTIAELLQTHMAQTGLFQPQDVKGMYYNGKRLRLDGYSFTECRFDNCVLEVTNTNFQLIRCVLDPSTQIIFGDEVLKIIKLFTSRFEWAETYFNEDFVPNKTENNTITIADNKT